MKEGERGTIVLVVDRPGGFERYQILRPGVSTTRTVVRPMARSRVGFLLGCNDIYG